MDLISLKWFLIEKVVNFGYLIKFVFDCSVAWIDYLSYNLVHTRQGQLIMLTAIIAAIVIDWKIGEKN